jgi:diguanylate cyclase (GGDEF)-like protein/PAS domain S-box-containing protein
MKTLFSGGSGLKHAEDHGTELLDLESPVRRSLSIRWLMVCGVLLVTAIAIGTAITIGNFRERALANSERELENTALLLNRHFDQQLQQLELVQTKLVERVRTAGIASRDGFEREMSGNDVHLMLQAKIEALPQVGNINLADADGKLINSANTWPVPVVSIADRAYFKALKAAPQLTTTLSEPVYNRITGAWTTILARSLTGPKGEFLGVVLGGIELAQFENFFTSLALGEGAAITILHRDGTLLARYPHVESMIGRNLKASALFQAALSEAGHGTARVRSALDGQDRLVAIRSLNHFPMVVSAATTVTAALAGWREQTRLLIGAAGLFALVIVLILFLIIRRMSHDHQLSSQRQAREQQRLDIATNNMTQGLLMVDASERIVVCNQRYIQIYGLSPDLVKPGCSFRDLMAHRKAIGSFAGDVAEYRTNTLREMALGKTMQFVAKTVDGRSIHVVVRPMENGGGWVATHEDVTERKQLDERIAHMAHHDALTDLPNRVLFREQLDAALETISPGEQLAVLYIDIDEFKSVNDSLGHPVGDELLKVLAGRLRGCLQPTDVVARLGGDEFAIIQIAIERPADTTDLVARIYQAIREPFECLGHLLTANASIGIALAPQDGTNLDQLLRNADLAMYGAKADGRRTYRFFEPGMEARVKALRTLELDLRQAIANGGFELHYQPLVNLADNRVTGCEALLRWRHPVRGMISPVEFIPVAEETGLINPLGEWVLNTACAEAARWPDDVTIAVNVSPVQFRSQAFALKVTAALAVSGLAAHRLELEITEAVLIRDDEAALAMLHELRTLGVRIALDDFGTGYSSLSYLQRFPFDKIKIDRCFIKDIAEPDGTASIVQAVVNIAAARDITTTAEGVETEQQLEMLRTLGCTEMQGWLFSRALPAADIMQLLQSRRETAVAAA